MVVDHLPFRRLSLRLFSIRLGTRLLLLLCLLLGALPALRAQTPDTPTGFAAVPAASHVTLSWNAVDFPENLIVGYSYEYYYDIYRATASGQETLLEEIPAYVDEDGNAAEPYDDDVVPNTSYVDHDVVAGRTYYYKISAVVLVFRDTLPPGKGQSTPVKYESNLSAEVSATPQVRIDSGGVDYTDGAGKLWSADEGFTGGTTIATTAAVTGTIDPTLYQAQRSGTHFTYAEPVANGTYVLSLLFAEIEGNTTGQRVFSVTANGTQVLTNFDIYAAAGGANKAVVKQFAVSVTNGQMSLSFDGVTGNAAVAAISFIPPGGTSATDIPPPGWAEDVVPADQSDAGGDGPSSSLSVSLPSGVLEDHPDADIDVFNPNGPSISYMRLYRSALAASGTYTPGLSPGWRDNYTLTITSSGSGSYTLKYPNGGAENWTTVSGVINPPSGAPYLVSVSGSALVMMFHDHSYYTFTPDPNNASSYLLTGISNLVGSTVTINRDSGNGNRITAFTDAAANPLLTLNYSGAGLANVTDIYGRVVTYTFSGPNLTTVSQVNAANTVRWQYSYTTINNQPFLSSVTVPDPASGNLSTATPHYTPDGHVASLLDAEGNLRTYNYGANAVSVSIFGSDNTLSQTWTQKFDAANHNVDKGVTDANGHSTNLVYGDAANPLKVTAATNKNGQTASATFDTYGNTSTVTDLRGVVTQNTYDPNFPLGQVIQTLIGANQPTPKTPTSFTYYDGTTQVNGVTQPKGLVKTISVPMPGTVGTGAQVTTTYTYTALGDVLTVTSPGPNISGATVTTTYNYTSDASYDVQGFVIQSGGSTYTTTEKLNQPLTVTDPLGNVSHYRYDSRGNTIIAITPPVVSYPDTTIARGLRTDYAYNAQNQLTGVLFPPLNPSAQDVRDSRVYTYEYPGGPLLTITDLDQDNYVVRQTNVGKGKEDEHKSQTGSVQQANFNYDPQYRLKQLVDGNNQPAQNYSYDNVGNLISETYALGDGTRFTQYDNDNNLMQMQNGRGIGTTYTRASDDSRVTGVTYSDGTPAVSFGSGGNGYDVYDRVTQYSDGVGSYTATYDDDDNLLSKTTIYTGLPPATVSYAYNNDGSRANLTVPKSLSGSAYSYWTFSYAYDSDGQIISLTCPWARSKTTTNLAVFSYYYDEIGRLLEQQTQKANTYYIYNSRGWLVQQQSANTSLAGSFNNFGANNPHPPQGTIPNRTAQGRSVNGDLNNCLLDDYSNMQYDSVGNRLRMNVNIPDFYTYFSNGNYTSYPPPNKHITGTLFYTYDIKDRLTLETTNDSNGNPTMVDYAVAGGGLLYNDNWNYPTAADLADNLTMVRGSAQSFNADDQLSAETYDLSGNRTSYDGSSIIYDANDLPISVPGNGGATPFTQAFTGDGDRAWKLPSGGSKTYYLYDGDAVLMEMNSAGSPANTYAYGPGGLLERFQNNDTAIPYIVYLFDPNGSLVHRVRSVDPNTSDTSNGAAEFVQDTAVYDSQGLLHGDINTLGMGFNSLHIDPVGYKGELGNYTDLETLKTVSGLYTSLSGPGGALYYDPLTGVGLAREQADSANGYADNLNAVEPALHNAFVDVTGLVAGPIGAGIIDAQITHIETGNVKTALVHGGTTAAVGLVVGHVVKTIGAPIVRYITKRLSSGAATAVAGAGSRTATSGEKYSSQEYGSYEEYLEAKAAGARAANQAGQAQIDEVIAKYGLGKHLAGKKVIYAGDSSSYTMPSGGVHPSDPNTIKIYSQGLAHGDKALVETLIEEIHHSKTLTRYPNLGTNDNTAYWNRVVEPRAKKYAAKYARRLGL